MIGPKSGVSVVAAGAEPIRRGAGANSMSQLHEDEMTKLRPISDDGRKAEPRALHAHAVAAGATRADGRPQPMDVTRKLSIHQATQTLRVAADVLIGVDCGDPLLNFRVRGLASAVRSVAGELDAVLIADDRLFARQLGASAE
jgi:hypothetical protein